jgi:putative nucleotidyltransferase with HDIG domain
VGVASLLFLVEQRDPAMKEHSQNVRDLALSIAEELRLEPQEIFLVRTAALLHDIGKIGLPDSLLLKGEPLTGDEQELIKQHPELNVARLQSGFRLIVQAQLVVGNGFAQVCEEGEAAQVVRIMRDIVLTHVCWL